MKNKIKPFLFDNIAEPIIDNNYKNYLQNKIEFHSFGKKNPKKFFYVIQRSPGAGLFSNLTFVLNHLLIAKKLNVIPIVDMENFITIYNENKKIENNYNAWNYYFEPLNNYKLKDVYQSKNVFITKKEFFKNFDHKIYNFKKFEKVKNLIKVKKNIVKIVEKFKKNSFKKKPILGIHYRGTSYKTSAGHPYPPTKKQMIDLINNELKKFKFYKIFFCTEDKEMFETIKSNFGSKLIYYNSYRSYKDNAFKIYPRKLHRYKLGQEILIESLILASCKRFIFVQTNVSNFVRFCNPKINCRSINNGLNSQNEYLAFYMWYLKKILPSFFFGFKAIR